jgi:hypothetical protein
MFKKLFYSLSSRERESSGKLSVDKRIEMCRKAVLKAGYRLGSGFGRASGKYKAGYLGDLCSFMKANGISRPY